MELLLNHQLVHGMLRYLVRWRGYTSADDTGLRLDELGHCPEQVAEYDAAAPRRRMAAASPAVPAPRRRRHRRPLTRLRRPRRPLWHPLASGSRPLLRSRRERPSSGAAPGRYYTYGRGFAEVTQVQVAAEPSRWPVAAGLDASSGLPARG